VKPETSAAKQPSREILFLFVALAVVISIAVLSYRSWAGLNRGTAQLKITQQITTDTNQLLSLLKDAETGQRGYILTGEERYLEPYRQALTGIPEKLGGLSAALTAHGDQAARVERLKPLVGEKLEELARTIELRRNQETEAALALIRTDRGKRAMDQIRQLCAEIDATENLRLNGFSGQARSSANQLGALATLGSAGIFALLLIATYTIQRGIRRRQQLIHELKESEARTRESRDWLQTTLGSIGDGVIATDGEGNVTFLNAVSQSLTGWSQEAAQGVPIERIFVIHNEDSGEVVENPVREALRADKVVSLANHTTLTARDGRRFPIDDSAAPIRSAGGQIRGVVLVFRDISERKSAEKELKRSNEELQRFAYVAAHDLKSPLRAVSSMTTMLARRWEHVLDAESKEIAGHIQSSVGQMSRLISDLLEYSTVTSDAEGEKASIDCGEIFAATVRNLQAQIRETGARVTAGPLPAVQASSQVGRVLQNLIENAIKYRGEATPQIHVSAQRADGAWVISVQDNGIGFDMRHAERIFGVFERLHTGEYEGSGIGLAICRKVIEGYGGRMWAQSTPGKGATFYFSLPAITGNSPGDSSSEAAGSR